MKRFLDFSRGSIGSMVLLVPALVVAALLLTTSPRPVLYWSRRVGRHGRIFQMPKFRTMKVGTPQVATDKLADPASQLTPIGGLLRKLSLAEIPQLWSVIEGDISLVGPRPALFNHHELIAARRVISRIHQRAAARSIARRMPA